MHTEELLRVFEIQVDNLIKKEYPKIAGIRNEAFLEQIEPLKDIAKQLNLSEINIERGYLPFVIVVKSKLITAKTAMSRVVKDGIPGTTKLFPREPQDFRIIREEEIPESNAYLLVGIDRGKENINLPPNEAMKLIRKANRYPLTIDEGIAIVTHYPDFLVKNNCFSLLASRHPDDKRVPAIWINSKKQPNLGWCWDGNPHTWLGSASCSKRIGS